MLCYTEVYCSAVALEPSHVVALTHSTIQNGGTALEKASIRGHHKIVEVLLGAGANPNLQDKVSTGQNRILSRYLYFCVHPHVLYATQAGEEPGNEARWNNASVPCVLYAISTVI